MYNYTCVCSTFLHYNVWYTFFRYRKYCTIACKPGSGRPSKITNHVQRIAQDDETTATQLHELLVRNGISISVLRCQEQLGRTF